MEPWTVKEALDEVVREIDFGAPGFSVNIQTGDSLRELYRKDFEKRKYDNADWHKEKEDVIPLCHVVGLGGQLLTLGRIKTTHGSVLLRELDTESVRDTAKWVARMHCKLRDPGGFGPRRKWCTEVSQAPLFGLSEADLEILEALAREKNKAPAGLVVSGPGDLDVEAALGEVVREIDRGAIALSLRESTQTGLRDLYREGFEGKQNAEWEEAHQEIFRLCRLIGAGAELLTLERYPKSEHLDEESVYEMAQVIARSHCSECRKWCQHVGQRLSLPEEAPDFLDTFPEV